MANQTDVLRPYKPQTYPSLPGSQELFVATELGRVAAAITQIIQVMKQLDARMVAHGI